MISAINQVHVVLTAPLVVMSLPVREHVAALAQIARGVAWTMKLVKTASPNQPATAAAAGESASVSPTRVGVAAISAHIHVSITITPII
jgi:hypothetical protein